MTPGEVPWAHTVFEQPWWLEATAPGRWGAVVVRRDGDVAARLPYTVKERLGLRVLTQAPLTRYVGPWIRPVEGKATTRLAREKDLMAALIDGLPECVSYRGHFAPAVTNWLPFHWAGFDATVHYTYRVDDLTDLDRVWADCAKDVRMKIRRAQRSLEIRTDVALDDVLALHHRIFARKGMATPFDDALAHRLEQACAARDARTVLCAVDADGRPHAAGYFVRDADATYLLYGGPDPERATSGAWLLVLWEALRSAAATGTRFDFLGSMIESVERVNRGFGALPVPYFAISRDRPALDLVRTARRTLRQEIRLLSSRRGRG